MGWRWADVTVIVSIVLELVPMPLVVVASIANVVIVVALVMWASRSH
jgi:hypothetical protein